MGEKGTLSPGGDPEDIHVLLVDNNPDNILILKKMLSGKRIQTGEADGMESALALFDEAAPGECPFRLVILDSTISGGRGLDLVESIRGLRGTGSPGVIVLTSAVDGNEAEQFRALGVRAYLQRPVTEIELMDAITSTIASESIDRLSEFSSQASGAAVVEPGLARSVLVAAGNPLIQRWLPRMLERRGHSVVLVSGGRDAVAALQTERFDIALLDAQAPEINIFEVAAAIRALEKGRAARVAIIAVTKDASQSSRDQFLASGMDGCIARPIHPGELFDRVENLSIIQVFEPEVTFDGALFDGDPEFLAEIVALFLETYPPLLAAIMDAISRGDAAGLCRSAHTLRGAVVNFGAKAVVEQVKVMEMLGKSGNLASAAEESGKLRDLLSKLVPELQSALNRALEKQVHL
jgi:two-component system sensor histidine kinase/response regulator